MSGIEGTDMAGLLFRKPLEIPHREDALDMPVRAIAAVTRDSSFMFVAFSQVDDLWYINLIGGYVRLLGRSNTVVPDSTDTLEIAGGSLVTPLRVCLQFDTTTEAVAFVVLTDEPSDSGTYWYRPLHEVYVPEGENPVYVRDRRTDWLLGSPI
jgi:hypothetical protein